MTVHQAYVMGVDDSFTYLTITLKKLQLMTNFKERRESILEVFNKAKEDLECLNGDI